jgi:hypothetical protein
VITSKKCHEHSLHARCHGDTALEGASTVNSADPRPDDEGFAAVEGDSLLDED